MCSQRKGQAKDKWRCQRNAQKFTKRRGGGGGEKKMKMLLLLKSIFSELRLDQGRISGLGWCICIKLCDELRKCLPSNRGKAEAGGMPAKRGARQGEGEGGVEFAA